MKNLKQKKYLFFFVFNAVRKITKITLKVCTIVCFVY